MDRLRWWEARRRRQLVAQFEDVVLDVFYVRGELVDQTVALLVHDLTVTLRWSVERAEGLARSEAQGKAQLDCWDDDVELAFPLAVAEDAQQFLHDTFEDTTWPACPTHLRHPLWLARQDEGIPTWRCPASDTSYGRLGGLTTGHGD